MDKITHGKDKGVARICIQCGMPVVDDIATVIRTPAIIYPQDGYNYWHLQCYIIAVYTKPNTYGATRFKQWVAEMIHR